MSSRGCFSFGNPTLRHSLGTGTSRNKGNEMKTLYALYLPRPWRGSGPLPSHLHVRWIGHTTHCSAGFCSTSSTFTLNIRWSASEKKILLEHTIFMPRGFYAMECGWNDVHVVQPFTFRPFFKIYLKFHFSFSTKDWVLRVFCFVLFTVFYVVVANPVRARLFSRWDGTLCSSTQNAITIKRSHIRTPPTCQDIPPHAMVFDYSFEHREVMLCFLHCGKSGSDKCTIFSLNHVICRNWWWSQTSWSKDEESWVW